MDNKNEEPTPAKPHRAPTEEQLLDAIGGVMDTAVALRACAAPLGDSPLNAWSIKAADDIDVVLTAFALAQHELERLRTEVDEMTTQREETLREIGDRAVRAHNADAAGKPAAEAAFTRAIEFLNGIDAQAALAEGGKAKP